MCLIRNISTSTISSMQIYPNYSYSVHDTSNNNMFMMSCRRHVYIDMCLWYLIEDTSTSIYSNYSYSIHNVPHQGSICVCGILSKTHLHRYRYIPIIHIPSVMHLIRDISTTISPTTACTCNIENTSTSTTISPITAIYLQHRRYIYINSMFS